MSALLEAERDQAESAFTGPLRALLQASPRVLAAAFVDSGGECVDYASRVAPHEAKVAAAIADLTVRALRTALVRLSAGQPQLVHVGATAGGLLLRPVDEEYTLAVWCSDDVDVDAFGEHLSDVAAALRERAGLEAPPWEPRHAVTEVQLRVAKGWPHAPSSFRSAAGRCQVEAVLGRWVEQHPLARLELECFRVRLASGRELTLSRDLGSDRWYQS